MQPKLSVFFNSTSCILNSSNIFANNHCRTNHSYRLPQCVVPWCSAQIINEDLWVQADAPTTTHNTGMGQLSSNIQSASAKIIKMTSQTVFRNTATGYSCSHCSPSIRYCSRTSPCLYQATIRHWRDRDTLRGRDELGVLKTKAPSTNKNLFQILSRCALGFSMCWYLYRKRVLLPRSNPINYTWQF